MKKEDNDDDVNELEEEEKEEREHFTWFISRGVLSECKKTGGHRDCHGPEWESSA
jgi:hypothetical protein